MEICHGNVRCIRNKDAGNLIFELNLESAAIDRVFHVLYSR